MYKVALFSGPCCVFGCTKKASDDKLGWGRGNKAMYKATATLMMQAHITISSVDVELAHMDISETSNCG